PRDDGSVCSYKPPQNRGFFRSALGTIDKRSGRSKWALHKNGATRRGRQPNVSSVTELGGAFRDCKHMTLIWTIVLAWFVLSLPLAVLVGGSIKLGMNGPGKRASAPNAKVHPAVVWC